MIYLACPYWNPDPAVRQARFEAVNRALTKLLLDPARGGEAVFSPISMNHHVGREAAEQHDWPWWLKRDVQFMEHCSRIVVLKLEGWLESKGVAYELGWFEGAGRPVEFLDPDPPVPDCAGAADDLGPPRAPLGSGSVAVGESVWVWTGHDRDWIAGQITHLPVGEAGAFLSKTEHGQVISLDHEILPRRKGDEPPYYNPNAAPTLPPLHFHAEGAALETQELLAKADDIASAAARDYVRQQAVWRQAEHPGEPLPEPPEGHVWVCIGWKADQTKATDGVYMLDVLGRV